MKGFVADKVVAVVLQDAGAEASVGQYLQDQNIPVIGAEGYDSTTWSARPNFFSITTTNPTLQQSYVSGAQAAKGKSIAVAVCAEAAACTNTGAVVSAQASTAGIQYAGFVKVSATAPSYTAECLSFIQKKVDVIAVGLSSDTGKRLVSDCQQQGFKGEYSIVSGAVDQADFDTNKGAKFVGVVNAFPWWSTAAPVRQYVEVLAKYAPNVDVRSTFPASMWASLELFKKAVSASPESLTPGKVADAYYSLKNETLGGLLPQPMNFTKGQPAPKVQCFWAYTFTGGDSTFESAQLGPSGNGASGDLSSSCIK
jgi:branched-chain amino acid transport system substrate-binding protein